MKIKYVGYLHHSLNYSIFRHKRNVYTIEGMSSLFSKNGKHNTFRSFYTLKDIQVIIRNRYYNVRNAKGAIFSNMLLKRVI